MRKGLQTFYLLVATQILSLIGSRMTSIAVGIWVFNETGNTTPLLLAVFFAELPGMLGGSLAGVLVDRWNRRRVMMLSDLGQAAGSLLLILSFSSGAFQLWHLYLISLLQGAFGIFQQPAQDAATTMLVSEGQRERANAIKQMAFPLAGVAAPVLAGLFYVVAGVSGVILIDLLTFLVAVLVVYLVHIPQPLASEEGLALQGNFVRELVGGFRFLERRRPLLYLVLYGVFINFMLNGPLELAIPYLITITGSEAQMGGLMGVMSLGAFSGALLIAVWGGTRPRIHTIMMGLLISGSMFLIYGLARSPLLLGASLFLLLMPLPVMNALWMSILQLKTPPDMQGRVFAVTAQTGYLGSTASFLLTGPLVDRILEPAVGGPSWDFLAPVFGSTPGSGIGFLLFATGVIILIVTTGVYLLPSVRHLESTLPDYQAVEDGLGGVSGQLEELPVGG